MTEAFINRFRKNAGQVNEQTSFAASTHRVTQPSMERLRKRAAECDIPSYRKRNHAEDREEKKAARSLSLHCCAPAERIFIVCKIGCLWRSLKA